MTQPHHHVFNVLQQEINRCVPVEPLLPLLLQNKVIKLEEASLFQGKNSMKFLTGYLRQRNYETFLGFVKCICEASESFEGAGKIEFAVVKSIQQIVTDFDAQHDTQHVKQIDIILAHYFKKSTLDVNIDQMSLEEVSLPDSFVTESCERSDFAIPDLPYLETPQVFKFSQDNNWTYKDLEQRYGVIIKGDSALEDIDFKVGICTHGPFAIPDKYRIVTCFLCVATSKVLTKPVSVTLQHCLLMSCYKQSKSILILHADHKIVSTSNSYIFEPCFDSNCDTYPFLFSDVPSLSFKIQQFCIICAALDVQHQEQSVAYHHDTLIQTPESTHEPPLHGCCKHQTECSCSPLIDHSKSSLKRKRSVCENFHSKRVKECVVEYTLLLIEPHNKFPPFSIYIFAFESCDTSLVECLKQAHEFYGSTCLTTATTLNGIFSLPELHIKENIIKGKGWNIHPKKSSSVVKETDIHVHKNSVILRTQNKLYPPRLEYHLEFDDDSTVHSELKCKFDITGFTCSDCTGITYFYVNAPDPHRTNDLGLYRYRLTLSDEQKCKIVDEDLFLKLYHYIKDWRTTGLCLGLNEARLNQICIQDPNPGIHEYTYQVFWQWKQSTSDKERTVAVFAKALNKANELDALSNLIKNV